MQTAERDVSVVLGGTGGQHAAGQSRDKHELPLRSTPG